MPSILDAQQFKNVQLALRGELSDEQVAFLDLDLAGCGLNCCCAVPGSGKSTTLGQLVARAVVEPAAADVLVLSSTVSAKNTALAKIRAAFDASGLSELGIAFPEKQVRTLHSIALQGNSSNGQRLQIASVVPFVEEALDQLLEEERLTAAGASNWGEFWRKERDAKQTLAKEAVRESLPFASVEQRGLTLYKKLAPNEREIAKRSGLDGDNPLKDTLHVRAELTTRMLPSKTTKSTRETVLEDAERRMFEENVTDHAGSLSRFAASKQPVSGPGSVLFVDETQDSTQGQVEIILAALRAGARVVILGDPSQGIFRFAGANENPMRDIVRAAQEEGFETNEAVLTENFRSTQQILEISQSVLPEADLEMRTAFSRKQGVPVRRIVSDSEPAAIVTEVKKMIAAGRQPGDIAVIRFKNFSFGADIHKSFSVADVPVGILGMPSDAKHPAARTLAIVRAVLGGEEDELFVLQAAVRAVAGCQMPDEVRKIVGSMAEEAGVRPLEAFLDTEAVSAQMNRVYPPTASKRLFGGAPKLLEQKKVLNVRRSIAIFRDAVRLVNLWVDAALEERELEGALVWFKDGRAQTGRPRMATLRASSALAGLLLQVHTQLVQEDLRVDELKPLLEVAGQVDELDLPGIQEFASVQADRLSEGATEKRVVLSTIHKFKGKERPVVVVCGLEKGVEKASVKKESLLCYSGLHDKDDCDARFCSCPRFAAKRLQLQKEATIERQRLLHVALSRPREVLVLSAENEMTELLA